MTPTYDDSPELAEGHDLPEAYVHPPVEQVWSPQPSIAPTYVSNPPSTYANTETYGNNGTYGNTGAYSDAGKGVPVGAVGGVAGVAAGTEAGAEAAYSTSPESAIPEKKAPAAVGGLSLVLILSIIIGILAAAVIGLAAGTGVATKNYNDANSKLAVLSSSLAAAQATPPPGAAASGTASSTGSSPSSSSTAAPDYNSITSGCSDDPDGVTGNIYTSSFFGKPHFTMYCDKDTINNSLLSVFATNFNGCMDACAAWNSYNTTTKGACVAVSFIPSWSILANAVSGGAPGDCYLKPGPQTKANLRTPNIGTECHAAIIIK